MTSPSLVYSTYLGSSSTVIRGGIAVDAAGDAYVQGSTGSDSFPTRNAYQTALAGGLDDFLTKLGPTGDSLLYSTYLGGSAEERYYDGMGLAIDTAGHAFITGYTESTDFPTTVNAYQRTSPGGVATYLAELDTNTSGTASFLYGTYFDTAYGGNAVAVDSSGNVYMTGNSGAVVKLNLKASGAASLVYRTFISGTAYTKAWGIALDRDNNAYITGFTLARDLPIKYAFQSAYGGGGNDGFVARLDAAGNVIFSTYIGGDGYDSAAGIAVDAARNVYVTGSTSSTNFPTAGAIQRSKVGGACQGGICTDAYLVKLSPAGNALLFGTTLGGSDDDYGTGIALDGAGNVYLAGYTFSSDFPTTACAFQSTSDDGGVFVVKISDVPGPSCTPTPQPTATPTPQPPAITIRQVMLTLRAASAPLPASLWHVGEYAVFLAGFRVTHGGSYHPTGSLQIRNHGRTVYSGHLRLVGKWLQARVHLTGAFLGQPTARFTVTVGPTTARKSLRFTVRSKSRFEAV